MAARAASDCAAMASRRKASGLTAQASYAIVFVVSFDAKVLAAMSCDVHGAAVPQTAGAATRKRKGSERKAASGRWTSEGFSCLRRPSFC